MECNNPLEAIGFYKNIKYSSTMNIAEIKEIIETLLQLVSPESSIHTIDCALYRIEKFASNGRIILKEVQKEE